MFALTVLFLSNEFVRLVAVAINSCYSFWWDVTNDWGLSLLRPDAEQTTSPSPSQPASPGTFPQTPISPIWSADLDAPPPTPGLPLAVTIHHQSQGLRPILLFNDPLLYYVAIGLNLILRLTWSLRLSSHLHTLADIEGGVFLLEALEIIRRWVWVFFRIEWETVKKTKHGQRREEVVELLPPE